MIRLAPPPASRRRCGRRTCGPGRRSPSPPPGRRSTTARASVRTRPAAAAAARAPAYRRCGRTPPRSRRTGSSRRRSGCRARPPSRHVLLRRLGSCPSTGSLCRPSVRSRASIRLLVAGLDHQRPHRLDHVDRARPVAVEVAGHQRVRAAQLAGPAPGCSGRSRRRRPRRREPCSIATMLAWKAVGRVVLVARDLHHRADLAAELVARGEAAVSVVPPVLHELRAGLVVGAA